MKFRLLDQDFFVLRQNSRHVGFLLSSFPVVQFRFRNLQATPVHISPHHKLPRTAMLIATAAATTIGDFHYHRWSCWCWRRQHRFLQRLKRNLFRKRLSCCEWRRNPRVGYSTALLQQRSLQDFRRQRHCSIFWQSSCMYIHAAAHHSENPVLLVLLLVFSKCEGWRSNAREQQKRRSRRRGASKRVHQMLATKKVRSMCAMTRCRWGKKERKDEKKARCQSKEIGKNQKIGQISSSPPQPQNFKRVVFSFTIVFSFLMYDYVYQPPTSVWSVDAPYFFAFKALAPLQSFPFSFYFFPFFLLSLSASLSLSWAWLYCS